MSNRMTDKLMMSEFKQAGFISFGIFLFLISIIPPVNISVDGNSMFWVGVNLVTQQSFESSSLLGAIGVGGKYYSIWYPLLSLIEIPFIACGFFVAKLMHLEAYKINIALVFCFLLQTLLVTFTSFFFFLILKKINFNFKNSFLLTLGLVFGTYYLVYVRSLFADCLLTFIVTTSVYLILCERSILSIGILSLLAILAKPTGIFLGPVISLYFIIEKKYSWQKKIIPLLGTIVGFVLYGYYNYIRFGSMLNFGSRPSLSLFYFPVGIIKHVLAPGYGVFWFNPVLFLAPFGLYLWLKNPCKEFKLFLMLASMFFGVYCFWPAAGWDWGSRHLLVILPIMFIFIGKMLETKFKKLYLILIFMGFIIHLPTIFSFYERYYFEAAHTTVSVKEIHWNPKYSPIIQVWPSSIHQIQDAL
ncbi:MAG: hypothetical protein HY072_04435, partial [Deltaproteobacteria bacterium]|nr:hypothetical protein [Deltaproteobacteria bacterium]